MAFYFGPSFEGHFLLTVFIIHHRKTSYCGRRSGVCCRATS